MAFTPPPDWADDTNYDAGANAWNGNPTKRAPSVGLSAKGIEPGEFLTAQHFNYLVNLFSQCVSELQDRADGEGLSRTIEIPFEWTNTAFDGSLNTGPEWNYVSPTSLTCPANGSSPSGGRNSPILLPLQTLLPDGAIITEISAVVTPGAARTSTNRMKLSLVGHKVARPGFVITTTTLAGTVEDSGVAAIQEILLSADVSAPCLPYTVDYATWPKLSAVVTSGTTDFIDELHSVRVTYTDIGPRSPGLPL